MSYFPISKLSIAMMLCEASVMRYGKPYRKKKSSRSLGSFHMRLPCAGTHLAGAEGIEPSSKVLETPILPLNYAPIYAVLLTTYIL